MWPPFTRPRVEDLLFRLYDRPVHPEFFDTLALRQVEHEAYRLTVRITRTGHAFTWSDGRTHLSEVTATRQQELPAAGGRITHRFQGERGGRCELVRGLRYLMNLQVEVLPAELFVNFQQELLDDGRRKGFVYGLPNHHRLGVSPLSVVIAQALDHSLSVSTFHTYPDEFAVIKTQSLIEWC